MKMTDFVRKPFGLGAKNNVLRVLRKIESFVMKILYPNITGQTSGNQDLNGRVNGAFNVISSNLKNSGNYAWASLIGFDASKSNQIYSGLTVQPNSLRLANICRI